MEEAMLDPVTAVPELGYVLLLSPGTPLAMCFILRECIHSDMHSRHAV